MMPALVVPPQLLEAPGALASVAVVIVVIVVVFDLAERDGPPRAVEEGVAVVVLVLEVEDDAGLRPLGGVDRLEIGLDAPAEERSRSVWPRTRARLSLRPWDTYAPRWPMNLPSAGCQSRSPLEVASANVSRGAPPGARAMVTVAGRPSETLPAASLA